MYESVQPVPGLSMPCSCDISDGPLTTSSGELGSALCTREYVLVIAYASKPVHATKEDSMTARMTVL
jgi:hypothetical protein